MPTAPNSGQRDGRAGPVDRAARMHAAGNRGTIDRVFTDQFRNAANVNTPATQASRKRPSRSADRRALVTHTASTPTPAAASAPHCPRKNQADGAAGPCQTGGTEK